MTTCFDQYGHQVLKLLGEETALFCCWYKSSLDARVCLGWWL